jgi:hypothetical protein
MFCKNIVLNSSGPDKKTTFIEKINKVGKK